MPGWIAVAIVHHNQAQIAIGLRQDAFYRTAHVLAAAVVRQGYGNAFVIHGRGSFAGQAASGSWLVRAGCSRCTTWMATDSGFNGSRRPLTQGHIARTAVDRMYVFFRERQAADAVRGTPVLVQNVVVLLCLRIHEQFVQSLALGIRHREAVFRLETAALRSDVRLKC